MTPTGAAAALTDEALQWNGRTVARKVLAKASLSVSIALTLLAADSRAGATIDLLFVGHDGGAIAATDTITVSAGDLVTMAVRMRNDSYLTIVVFSLNYDLDGDDELDVVSVVQWAGVPISKVGADFFTPIGAFSPTTATFVGSFQGLTNDFSLPRQLPPSDGSFAGGYQMGTVTWKVNAAVNMDGADILSGLLNPGVDGFIGCLGTTPCTSTREAAFADIADLVQFNAATVNVVPEPATASLLGLGLLALVLVQRRGP